MGFALRLIWRLIKACFSVLVCPLIFVLAGILGAWAFVMPRRDEQEDGRTTEHDITNVAPADEDEEGIRKWLFDRSPLGRLRAVEAAQAEEAALVNPNPIPIHQWYRDRKIKRMAAGGR